MLLFTAVDCPISDRYAPEVRRLAARFGDAGVRFWVVYANAGKMPAAARDHAADFGYGLPVALDPQGQLANRALATVTPEAAVFDGAGHPSRIPAASTTAMWISASIGWRPPPTTWPMR